MFIPRASLRERRPDVYVVDTVVDGEYHEIVMSLDSLATAGRLEFYSWVCGTYGLSGEACERAVRSKVLGEMGRRILGGICSTLIGIDPVRCSDVGAATVEREFALGPEHKIDLHADDAPRERSDTRVVASSVVALSTFAEFEAAHYASLCKELNTRAAELQPSFTEGHVWSDEAGDPAAEEREWLVGWMAMIDDEARSTA